MPATSAPSDTSASKKNASPPSSLTARAVSSPLAMVRSTTTTLAPSAAKARQLARPIPDPPPVMTATLSCRRPIGAGGYRR
jgi:hypothetical protein